MTKLIPVVILLMAATSSTVDGGIIDGSSPNTAGATSGGFSTFNTWGAGATVSWSLTATGVDFNEGGGPDTFTALADFMPLGFKDEIVSAFAAWSAVADITFVEVADNGVAFNAAGATGDIRIAGHAFDGPGGTLAHGFFPPPNGASAAGDIHFDIAENWVIGFPGPGFDIFQVAAHEIGHAIGLNHTNVPNSLMNPSYTEAFSGPQADDIAGAQFLYGAAGVPEPSQFAFFGLLLTALAVRRRRCRSARVFLESLTLFSK